jgi:two-component system phosphate regulon sensor histidine kinase PhoR
VRLGARERGPWLVFGVLSLLLATLGVLQYRWSRELGRAAAERRQADLERAARRFAAAVERELGQASIAFFDPEAPWSADRRGDLLSRLAAWQQRDRAGLVTGVLLASRTGSGELVLEECRAGDDSFHPVGWPEGLRELGRALASGAAPGEEFPIRPGAIVQQPLGLVLPVFGAPPPGTARRLPIDGAVVVLLDPFYMQQRLLPRLVEAQLGADGSRVYEVAVRGRADRTLFFASDALAVQQAPQSGDVELPLPSRGRGPGGAIEAHDEAAPWLLVMRHRGGSFEAAVASVQRRTLATGLFVLALLGATVLVLFASAQRARGLARQQVEFVTSVTHELNTPLAAIRSAGQNLAAGIVKEEAQVRRYGQLIEREGARLGGLVTQVLDFAGIESGGRSYAREPLSLPELLDEVVRENRLVLEQAGISLEREIARDLPQLRGDGPALRRALANLLTNAAKFAAAGHWIGIRADARPDGRAVVLRVEDRGPGIPPGERERVFEPFYRGGARERNDAPGSGLGLSIVRHVVRAHGGSVRVEGREGGGAALVIELPTPAGSPA